MSDVKLKTREAKTEVLDFRADLNDEQYRVVTQGDGPCLVLAGAGSGKTRTVVYRVAYLISKGVQPDEILLLTFTNKAAGEMMDRIDKLLKGRGDEGGRGAAIGTPSSQPQPPRASSFQLPASSSQRVWGGTFHSVANRILRQYADRLDFSAGFTILDADDTKAMIKVCIKELGYDGGGKKRFPSPALIHSIGSYAKNSMTSVNTVLERKHADFAHLEKEIVAVLETYDRKKRHANAMDFDDLLMNFYVLLTDFADVRQVIANRFRYVLVDEYQDTNALQDSIVRLISEKHGNVLAVGDDAQSIYSFRAADVRNILNFPARWSGVKKFMLETNYRSTPQILDLANDIISKNSEQFQKTLRAVLPGSTTPSVKALPSASREAEFIANKIEDLVTNAGTNPREIAVLFRATHHSMQLEVELRKRRIEYDYRGGTSFFSKAHVKDVLSFLRLLHNFTDEAAWRRVLSFQQGIGEATAGKIYSLIMAQGDLAHVLLAPIEGLIGKKAALGWRDLRETLEALSAADGRPHDSIQAVLDSPYMQYLNGEYDNARERSDNLNGLAAFADGYDDLGQFLADVALNDELHGRAETGGGRQFHGRKIILSTIHQAKGLEWDTVFVMHLTGSSFPNQRAFAEQGGLEEERRLFYVAVTRAKRRLFLCYPRRGGYDGATMEYPSMFITEADPNCLDLPDENLSGGYDERRAALSFSDPDPGFEEEVVELDESGEIREVKERLKEWRKKSFLREV
ncbi:MAG: ATP-dependent helicase [Patescibacteria group bacterium]